MEAWGKVLNAGQKTFATLMLGLTIYGGYVMAAGGYRVVQRSKQQKAEDNAEVKKVEEVSLITVAVWSATPSCWRAAVTVTCPSLCRKCLTFQKLSKDSHRLVTCMSIRH